MLLASKRQRKALKEEFDWFLENLEVPKLRTMQEFAEQEIILTTGPFKGLPFLCERQPYSKIFFEEMDSRKWRRIIATGPTQSGKSLSCFVIPLMYYLFEVRETCILAAPKMDICTDKWNVDILPIIENSRYADLLPRRGAGSKGGSKVMLIPFRNGTFLKMMTGGGDDKNQASFTSKYVFITETDGMDEAGKKSRESDPITRIEGRMRSFDDQGMIVMECTVSTESGRTWNDYVNRSTHSQLVKPCPHCEEYISLERDCLTGWQSAKNKIEAGKLAEWHCPKCGEIISDEQRIQMNMKSRLLHDGQSIDKFGNVTGDAPETDGLGFRWTASDNQLRKAKGIGEEEWDAINGNDEVNAELKLRQQTWCIPAESPKEDDVALSINQICSRVKIGCNRGIVPQGYQIVTVGTDIGKYEGHWVAIAWGDNATGHIIDYGEFPIRSREIDVEEAIYLALVKTAGEVWDEGWRDTNDQKVLPKIVWVDAGYKSESVYKFCKEDVNKRYVATKGFGSSADLGGRYNEMAGPYVGAGYQPGKDFKGFAVDADHWKTFVHFRLNTPKDKTSAMTLFDTEASRHRDYAKHILAEQKRIEFVPGKGNVTHWERVHKANHKLDCTALASAAGHYCGVRLLTERVEQPQTKRRVVTAPYQRRDGREWLQR